MLENCHGCSKCKRILSETQWSKDVLKHHQAKKRELVCSDCQQKGYSTGRYEDYPCKQCQNSYGSLKYNAQDLKNFKRENQSKLICQECKSKLRCAACKVAFPRTAWTKKERDNYECRNEREKPTALVCKGCRKAGYTPDDVETYTCQHCHKKEGCKSFDPELIHHRKTHGRQKMICNTCIPKLATRTKELQAKLRKSKRVCNCFCPIHKDRCPLTPCHSNDRRWPGNDGYISAADREFLDNLNPQPEWWTRAKGGRKTA